MKVSVNLEHLEENLGFELSNDARIGALRKALSDNEGVVDSEERIRLYFKTTAGHNLGTYDSSCSRLKIKIKEISCLILGVEDDETIAEFLKESGEFQAIFTNLATINGYVRIEVEQSLIGDAQLLMGGTDVFETYLLNKEELRLKVPNGNFFKTTYS